MPLPTGFSAWEHLQETLRKVHNKRVREFFSDLDPDDLEIETPRGALKTACTMQDEDTATMSQLRLDLYWMILGGAAATHPPLYTIPTDRYQIDIRFAPQITLYFREQLDDVEEGYKPIDAEISFRLRQETSETFTPAEALSLARTINRELGGITPYRWHKGRTKLSYRDKDHGYQFSINAFSEAEGREVIHKVLGLQNHAFDGSLLTISNLAETPAITPGHAQIYGRSRRLPRKRPVGWVHFRYADCHIWGIPQPITLVDLTQRRSDALIGPAGE